MPFVSSGRPFIAIAAMVLAACGNLDLPRIAQGTRADSTPEPASTSNRRRDPREKAIPTTAEAASFAEISRSLRRLVVAEETFFAENGTYTDDLSVIRVTPVKNVRSVSLVVPGWLGGERGPHFFARQGLRHLRWQCQVAAYDIEVRAGRQVRCAGV